MIVSVFYPNDAGSKFDMAYYCREAARERSADGGARRHVPAGLANNELQRTRPGFAWSLAR